MKHLAEDSIALAARLREFMLGAGWEHIRSARGLSFFSPPESLGIRGKYTIALPDNPALASVSSLIYGAADALVQIYGYSQVGDLLNLATSLSDQDRSTRIISRFHDETTKGGAIPLAAIAAYVTNMEATLYHSAKFQLGDETAEADLTAKQFANDCLFLQTAVGSFVAKVEVPQSILRQPDLFGNPALGSTDIASSLFAAIHFLNDQILRGESAFDDSDTLSNAVSLFDVELLTAIADVILEPDLSSIDFSFEFGNKVRTTSTGWMSAEKRNRLRDFVAFIKEQLRAEDNISVVGTIVELRSRDPAGDRNRIRVVADFYGDRTFITATLTNSQYQRALEAHQKKRSVRVTGRGLRLKTQIRILELKTFD
jgi:hypothetical protein